MSTPKNRSGEIPIARGRPGMERSGDAAAERDSRSIPELIRELSSEGADLVRQEVALAKTELSEKLDTYRSSMIAMAAGGGVLLAALLLLIQALSNGLTALLAQGMDLEIAVWLAPLILTVVVAAIGWGMISGAKKKMADEGLTPELTKQTLIEDKRWASRKVGDVKEEIKHG
jgi:hypothetical protein